MRKTIMFWTSRVLRTVMFSTVMKTVFPARHCRSQSWHFGVKPPMSPFNVKQLSSISLQLGVLSGKRLFFQRKLLFSDLNNESFLFPHSRVSLSAQGPGAVVKFGAFWRLCLAYRSETCRGISVGTFVQFARTLVSILKIFRYSYLVLTKVSITKD